MLVFVFQPIIFEHKRPAVRESRTFLSDLVRICVLCADQKKTGSMISMVNYIYGSTVIREGECAIHKLTGSRILRNESGC